MSCRRVRQSNRSFIFVTPIDVVIAVTVDDLIPVHKNKLRWVGLLDALGQRFLLGQAQRLIVSCYAGGPMTPRHGRVVRSLVIVLKTSSSVHAVLVVARAGACCGPGSRRLRHLHVVAV